MSNLADVFPLSPMQRGMLFETLSAPDLGIYTEQVHCELAGAVNLAAFTGAWELATARHAALRTAFAWQDITKPVQALRSAIRLPVVQEDWSRVKPDDFPQHLAQFLQRDRERGFDLKRAPLMRLALIRLANDRYQFVWTYHHCVLDGWSEALLLGEILSLYGLLACGKSPNLPDERAYRDYIAWLQRQDAGNAEAYWRREFEEIPEWPPAFVPDQESLGGSAECEYELCLSANLSAAIDAFLREHTFTLSTLLLGAWALLLSRCSDVSELTIGLIVSGRPPELPGATEMIGLFVNTLPLRIPIPEHESAITWLSGLQRKQAELQTYQASSLADIQHWTGIPASSLVENLFVVENYPVDLSLLEGRAGLGIRNFKRESTRTRAALTLAIVPGKQITIKVARHPEKFPHDLAQRLPQEFERLLANVIAAPGEKLINIRHLAKEQEAQLLAWAGTETSPEPRCIHHAIAEQSAHSPNEAAVVSTNARFTYNELERAADRLARRLLVNGASPEKIVGLWLPRGAEMTVAILGVLKAGAAYLVLDLSLPPERLAWMVDDAKVGIIVCGASYSDQIPNSGITRLMLDSDTPSQELPTCNANACAKPENLAYVIYTSGSSGRPKGVLVEHRNLSFSTQSRVRYYGEPPSSFLLLSPFTFDSSVAGLFWTLSTGGTLVVPSDEEVGFPGGLRKLLIENRVSHLLTTPSFYSLLLEMVSEEEVRWLRTVIVAGEALSTALVRRHFEKLPQVKLFNEYGPTEATVWSTVHSCQPHDKQSFVPIGRSIPGARSYVLDRSSRLVAPGVVGELYIGGPGVARGYLNEAELTQQRFLNDPYDENNDARIYRTGDRVRHREDGLLEFLGRQDDQIKLRGYRIELAEVEAALRRFARIQEAAVFLRDAPAGKQLVACYQTINGAVDEEELARFLKAALPSYMVPSVFVYLPSFPLTRRGKIDRRALAIQCQDFWKESSSPYASSDDREETLAAIWRTVLKLPQVGRHENFFQLGGDSILILQLVWRAREAGLDLSPQQVFEHPTISELARNLKPASSPPVDQGVVYGSVPLTPIQLWFFEQQLAEPHHFTQSVVLELSRHVDLAILQRALTRLVSHHDALRMRFAKSAEGWTQTNAPEEPIDLCSQQDLSGYPSADRAALFEQAVVAEQGQLDLSRGPQLRATLFHFGPDTQQQMLIVVHHLVIDAISWRILLEDLDTLIKQETEGRRMSLPAKTVSYQCWAQELRDRVECCGDKAFERWQSLSGCPVADLPLDYSTGENTFESEREILVSLTAQETTAVNRLATLMHCVPDEAMLAALAAALASWTGSDAVLVDCESHGRDFLGKALDTSRTIGWLTAIFPVLLKVRGSDSPLLTLQTVKKRLRELRGNSVEYGLLRYLGRPSVTQALREFPQAQVGFNYFGHAHLSRGATSFHIVSLNPAGTRSPRNSRPWLLEVNCWLDEGGFEISFRYSVNRHSQRTIQRLAEEVLTRMRDLMNLAENSPQQAFVPSDFPLVKFDHRQLTNLVSKIGKP